jgi:microcystin degradation protein MlrC
MGASAIVVTDGDAALARQYADELAAHLWRRREKFRGPLIGVEEAVDQLDRLPAPVCLLDMGDNVGAGSPADGTALARRLHDRGVADSLVCLNDPEAARLAARTGVGRAARFRVGGKTDNLHGEPLEVDCEVLGLYDGKFREPQARHGGFAAFDQGATAVLRTSRGMTLLVTSRRAPPWSLAQLTSCGLRPESFRAIVAKGVNSPLAAYQPVCRSFVRVNTPGVTCADMASLAYHRRRRPMFPFEADAAYG